jgi:hypothetical protein
VLMAQRDKAKDVAMADMKASGVEYDERIEELDKINYPQPMRDQIYDVFDRWREANAWIGDRNIAPKGVVRDMWDRAMDFPSFVKYFGIKRSEGLLLRYLSDVYKTTLRAVPDDAKTDEVTELTDWLGAVIRTTDSSLLDEWTEMFSPDETVDVEALERAAEPEVDITTDRRAFRALVRTRVFRWVQFAAACRWEAWSEDLTEIGNHGWIGSKLDELFQPFAESYPDLPRKEAIGIDGDARGPDRFIVVEGDGQWTVEQILADPDSDDEWYLEITVDLDASAEAGEIVARLEGLTRR